jgi:hypothetical protein
MDTKQILRNKLKQKIQEKSSQRYQLTKKSLEKIKRNVDDEKKQMDTDTRVSYLMKKAYVEAMGSSPDMTDIKNPVYVLDHMEESKIKFYEFLTKFMGIVVKDVDAWKAEMVERCQGLSTSYEKQEYLDHIEKEYKKKFKTYFHTPYIVYMSLMTDITFEDLIT